MKVSFVHRLSADLRAQLDSLIRARGYGDCHAVAAWLTEQGHPISAAPVGLYAKKLKHLDWPDHGLSPEKIKAAIDLGVALQQFQCVFFPSENVEGTRR